MPEPFSTPLHRPYRHSRPPQTGSRSRGGDREPPRLAGEERALWRRYCGALPGSISGPGRAGISHPALALHLCTLALAWGLKGYYSRATADELFWLLASLARLAGFLCNLDFVWVPGTGFVHHARGVCIAPACAGMNFLIVCFVALHRVFMRSFQSRKTRYTGCGGWRMVLAWASLLPFACGAALFVNTLRVAGSVLLYGADIYAGWFTVALVHELFGICLYLGALVVVCTVADIACTGPGRGGPIPCGHCLRLLLRHDRTCAAVQRSRRPVRPAVLSACAFGDSLPAAAPGPCAGHPLQKKDGLRLPGICGAAVAGMAFFAGWLCNAVFLG